MTDYAKFMDAKLQALLAKSNGAKTPNTAKLEKLKLKVSHKDVVKMLKASNVNESAFSQNVYAVEKLVNFSYEVAKGNVAKMNGHMHRGFITLVRLHDAKLTFTRNDARANISKDYAPKDAERAQYIVCNPEIKDGSTVGAQHNSNINAFVGLGMLKEKQGGEFEIIANKAFEQARAVFNI